jgi:hypothetical protein
MYYVNIQLVRGFLHFAYIALVILVRLYSSGVLGEVEIKVVHNIRKIGQLRRVFDFVSFRSSQKGEFLSSN